MFRNAFLSPNPFFHELHQNTRMPLANGFKPQPDAFYDIKLSILKERLATSTVKDRLLRIHSTSTGKRER